MPGGVGEWYLKVKLDCTPQMRVRLGGASAIYEYACHEGNYGMFGILSGERAQERTAAAKSGLK